MARQLRIEYPGAVYHVTGRGNARQDVYLCDDDRSCFLNILQQVNHRYNWICHAYCLMDNHYHLLIETPDGNLSHGMRQLGGVYTQYFNRSHDRVGHLFQGRYKAVLVQKESHLLEAARYVVLNPLRAGMVKTVVDWLWSSYLSTIGEAESHRCLTINWILEQFNTDPLLAMNRYRQFVAEGADSKSLWKDLKGRTLLGQDNFVDQLNSFLNAMKDISEVPRGDRLINRPLLGDIFIEVAQRDKKARNDRIIVAVEKHGYTQKEIATHLGLHYSTISRLMRVETSKLKT